jgi:dolichol-phosphate mannosyltransferase
LNDAWTFRDTAKLAPGFRAKIRRFLAFNAICSIGLVLNVVLLNVLFNFAGMNRYLANAVAIFAVTAWNYLLNRTLNWSPLRTRPSLPPSGPQATVESASDSRTT